MPTVPFKGSPLEDDLRKPEFAALYLEEAIRDGVPYFIIALRHVAEAHGGIGKLAQLSNLGRESLYKTLRMEGSSRPHFATIWQILDALGMEISIHPKDDDEDAA